MDVSYRRCAGSSTKRRHGAVCAVPLWYEAVASVAPPFRDFQGTGYCVWGGRRGKKKTRETEREKLGLRGGTALVVFISVLLAWKRLFLPDHPERMHNSKIKIYPDPLRITVSTLYTENREKMVVACGGTMYIAQSAQKNVVLFVDNIFID